MKKITSTLVLTLLLGFTLQSQEMLIEEIEDGSGIYYLDYKISKKKTFPDIRKMSKTLIELNISSCEFTEIPMYLGDFKKLRKLTISFTPIKKFPDLPNIKELEIFDTKDPSLFLSVLETNSIENLRLLYVNMKNIPSKFQGMKTLKEVIIESGETSVKDLGNLFKNWTNLEKLVLAGVDIPEIPKSIKSLKNLSSFELQFSDVDKLPKQFAKLKNLKYVNLYHAKIKGIPKSIYKLKKLEHLVLNKALVSQEELDLIKKKLPNCELIVLEHW
jgi:Leucine-rich repeat (LRR) protein